MEAKITKTDGTIIEAKGTPEEIATLVRGTGPGLFAAVPSPFRTIPNVAGMSVTQATTNQTAAAVPFVWTTGETDHG